MNWQGDGPATAGVAMGAQPDPAAVQVDAAAASVEVVGLAWWEIRAHRVETGGPGGASDAGLYYC